MCGGGRPAVLMRTDQCIGRHDEIKSPSSAALRKFLKIKHTFNMTPIS
jgi:hypothetical protein